MRARISTADIFTAWKEAAGPSSDKNAPHCGAEGAVGWRAGERVCFKDLIF